MQLHRVVASRKELLNALLSCSVSAVLYRELVRILAMILYT